MKTKNQTLCLLFALLVTFILAIFLAPKASAAPFYVTYDANGATSGTAPADATAYNNGETATPKDKGNLANTNAVFMGWSTTALGVLTTAAQEAALTIIKSGSTFTITANTTLYAVWGADNDQNGIPDYKQRTVTYDANGATSGTAPIDATTHITGDTVTSKDKGNLAKTNAVFIGWSTSAVGVITTAVEEAAVNVIKSGDTFVITSNLTLYAVWGADNDQNGIPDHKEVTVTYHENAAHPSSAGAVPTVAIQEKSKPTPVSGDTGNLVMIPTDQLIFAGWSEINSCAPVTTSADLPASFFAAGDSLIANANNNLYVVWAFDRDANGVPDYIILVPSQPTNLIVYSSDAQIRLSWSAPASNGGSAIINYEVSSDNSTWITATGTSHTFSGLANGANYTFYVRAVNMMGAGPSSSKSATPIAPPTPPTITTPTQNRYNFTQLPSSSNDYTAKSRVDFSQFKGVYIDGSLISRDNYAAQSGSTIVKLNANYINTLKAGEHTIGLLFSGGLASGKFTISGASSGILGIGVYPYGGGMQPYTPSVKTITAETVDEGVFEQEIFDSEILNTSENSNAVLAIVAAIVGIAFAAFAIKKRNTK